MVTVCLVVASAALVAELFGSYILVRKARAHYERLADQLNWYVSSPGPDTPSPFAKTVDNIAIIIADRIRVALMAAERGAQGAAVRDVNKGLEEYAVQNNPAAAVAATLSKSLKKNNLAAAGLQMLIQNLMAGGLPGGNHKGSTGSGSGTDSGQSSFAI